MKRGKHGNRKSVANIATKKIARFQGIQRFQEGLTPSTAREGVIFAKKTSID